MSTFKYLKKVIPIFFLAVYLLSTTQLIELLKLPILFEHYQEHSQINKNLSVIGFLKIHYAKEVTKDADYDQDMKLPFKSYDCLSNTLTFYFSHFHFFGLLPKNQFTALVKTYSRYQFTYSSIFLSSIWQPPKYC